MTKLCFPILGLNPLLALGPIAPISYSLSYNNITSHIPLVYIYIYARSWWHPTSLTWILWFSMKQHGNAGTCHTKPSSLRQSQLCELPFVFAYYGPCGRFGNKNSNKNLAFEIPYTPLLLPTHIVSYKIDGELAWGSSRILLSGTKQGTKFSLDGPEIVMVVERGPNTLCNVVCILVTFNFHFTFFFFFVWTSGNVP